MDGASGLAGLARTHRFETENANSSASACAVADRAWEDADGRFSASGGTGTRSAVGPDPTRVPDQLGTKSARETPHSAERSAVRNINRRRANETTRWDRSQCRPDSMPVPVSRHPRRCRAL